MKRRAGLLAALAFALAASPAWAGARISRSPYDALIAAAARNHDIPEDFLHAVIRVESNYDASAVSRKGAVGLMQLMPATASRYGVLDSTDPAMNLEGGCRYLKDLMRLFQNDRDRVLAAYNAGQEAVKKYGGIPPYRETIAYIRKISAAYTRATISGRTRIYSFVDASGRTVFTNDPLLYSINAR